MCCFMKCRVPRTKQEIEADCHRRELTLQFRKQLNKIAMDDLTFLKGSAIGLLKTISYLDGNDVNYF